MTQLFSSKILSKESTCFNLDQRNLWITIGQRDKERLKRAYSPFINDLKIYQESHCKLKFMN